jgi:hypothetical protein
MVVSSNNSTEINIKANEAINEKKQSIMDGNKKHMLF